VARAYNVDPAVICRLAAVSVGRSQPLSGKKRARRTIDNAAR
jgi:hypothetical protein